MQEIRVWSRFLPEILAIITSCARDAFGDSGQVLGAEAAKEAFQAWCCGGHEAIATEYLLPYQSAYGVDASSAGCAKSDVSFEMGDEYCRDTIASKKLDCMLRMALQLEALV